MIFLYLAFHFLRISNKQNIKSQKIKQFKKN